MKLILFAFIVLPAMTYGQIVGKCSSLAKTTATIEKLEEGFELNFRGNDSKDFILITDEAELIKIKDLIKEVIKSTDDQEMVLSNGCTLFCFSELLFSASLKIKCEDDRYYSYSFNNYKIGELFKHFF